MRLRAAVLALAIGGSVVGCQAERQDLCGEGTDRDSASHPDLCVPCATDDECVFMGNPCEGTFTCAHREANIAFTSIGCSSALEAEEPPDSACRCAGALCRVIP